MALSGSVNYSRVRDQVIDEAFALCGVKTEGQTPKPFDIERAHVALNVMLKAWQTDGLHIWVRKEGTIFLEKSKTSYLLGPGGSYATKDTPVITQLNGALAASATAVTVDDTTGMSASDKVGIVLSDNTIHWDTISGAPGSSTTFTLTTGVASAAADNAYVYTFTNLIDRPINILHSALRNTSNIDIPMTPLAQQDYRDLPNKTSTGTSTQYYYDEQLTNGVFYVWPAMNTDNYIIKLLYVKEFDDMDNANDDFEFPNEWLEAITWGLAARLCPVFGVPNQTWDRLRGIAKQMKEDVMGSDVENASMFIQPEYRY